MLKLVSIIVIILQLQYAQAEIIKNEQNLRKIFQEFQLFAQKEFFVNYPLPVNMELRLTGAGYSPMNGRAGFKDDLGYSVGRPDAVKADITLSFSKYRFSDDYSREGFIWVACHEVGHLVGGSPVNEYLKGFSAQEGLTIEGQADYFASSICMGKWLDWIKVKKLPNPEFNTQIVHEPFISDVCEKRFSKNSEIQNCRVKLMAATEAFRLVGDDDFKYSNMDYSRSEYMYTAHPKVECRGTTAFNAVMGFERPLCWFVPEKLKKLEIRTAINDSLGEPIEHKTFCGKMMINIEILQKNFEKAWWEPIWDTKNFKRVVRRNKKKLSSIASFCNSELQDDAEVSKKYLEIVRDIKQKLRM
ncbi:MAG: ImmA/IrrE family metallo-endopeptidase [Bacteriovoracaceae bacterium]